ncbi:hypothetical protein BKA62DRAFT_318508 [Auriculariales sp. MPI-PUGE-AT-0066]|nr:hypothetical protein BKA62DRAFT_318508 [Auriculariales sp. MPI-PUGE-AT-0066]
MDPPFAQPPLSNAAIRSRVTVVCTECKRLKLKCDRKAPCSSCIKRNASAQCQYATNTPNPPDVQTLHQRVSKLEVTMRTHNRNTRDALETRRIPRTIHVAAYSSNVSATPRAGSVLTTPLTGLGRTVTCHVHLDDATQLWADHLLPTPLHETTLVPVTYFAHEPELILPDSTLFVPLNVDALLGRLPPLHLRAALLDSFAQVLHIHTGLEVHRICTGVLSVFHGSAGLAVEPPSCDLPAGFTLPGFALAAASFALGARLYLSSRGHESAEEANGLDPTALMVLSFDTLFLHERKTHTPDCNIEHVLALIVQIHFRLLEGDHNPSPQDMPYCGESLHRTVYPTLLRAISLARTMGLHLQVSNPPRTRPTCTTLQRRRMRAGSIRTTLRCDAGSGGS